MCSCLADRNIHYKKGNIATGDQFIATKEQKDYISNTFDAIAAEMEGGSIGHVCYVNKVPLPFFAQYQTATAARQTTRPLRRRLRISRLR